MHRCIKKLDVSRCKITDAAKLLKQSSVTSVLKQMTQRDSCLSDKQKTFIIKINLTNLNRMSNGATNGTNANNNGADQHASSHHFCSCLNSTNWNASPSIS